MTHETCVPVCVGVPALELEAGYRALVGGSVWADGDGEGGV